MNRLACVILLLVLPINLGIQLLLCVIQNGKRNQWRKVMPEMRRECQLHGVAALNLIEGVIR